MNNLFLGRFHTFSNGFLIGKQKLGFNYTQTIQCTPNKEHLKITRAPVQYLKQLYTRKNCLLNKIILIYLSDFLVPIYNENEKQLEWFVGPILESKESSICPNGFKLQNSLCHGI
jgi:hypothetical protein